MSQKPKSSLLSTVFKWIIAVVCVLLGIKVFMVVASALTVGMALATVLTWGLGAVLVGGTVLVVAIKMLGGKKK